MHALERNEISVLLIEENRVEVLNLVRAFNENKLSYPIHTAENPAQGIALLRSEEWSGDNPRPNVVLLSLPLKQQGTFHFLRIVRSDPQLSELDIFVLSRSEHARDLLEAYKYHIQGYLPWPQGQENLRQLIFKLGQFWSISQRPRTHHILDKNDDTTRSQVLID